MNWKQFTQNEDAVSPVIGVILMVAITVILAAVIGTFVLGLGQNVQESSPTASISFDQSGDGAGNNAAVTISHDGGDPLKDGNIEIQIDGALQNEASNWASKSTPNNKVTAGESIEVGGSLGTGATIKVVWTSEGGGTSNVLAEYEVE